MTTPTGGGAPPSGGEDPVVPAGGDGPPAPATPAPADPTPVDPAPADAAPPAPARRRRWRRWRAGLRRVGDWSTDNVKGALLVALVTAGIGALVAVLAGDAGSGGGESATPEPVLPSGTPGPATPVCRGGECSGKDPGVFGCGDDAVTLTDRKEPVHLEIRYSAHCEAAWGRIQRAAIGDGVVISAATGRSQRAVISSYYDVYTPMAPAEGEFELEACAEPDAGDGTPRWERFCVTADHTDR